ncbi:MAG: 2-oxoacid:acceptor oxidoreductase family protein [Acidobacteria bacterium]|nr:2-oxoacid:acceptor oxidoreductase family protein [Acidobacteriota bacterium]
MSAVEVQIGGFGGQGVILAGMVIGRGLALCEGYNVSLMQSFGPEARGSACSVQLVVSRDPIFYPYITRPNILVALSQEAYRKFVPQLQEGGILLAEEQLVRPEKIPSSIRFYAVPATRLAEELGRKLVLNMVAVGFFAAMTGLLQPDSAQRAIAEAVPEGTQALNLAAFEKGYEYGIQQFPHPSPNPSSLCG